jgi:hypothetical protein
MRKIDLSGLSPSERLLVGIPLIILFSALVGGCLGLNWVQYLDYADLYGHDIPMFIVTILTSMLLVMSLVYSTIMINRFIRNK